jgi:hypothetical protein
MATKRKAHTMAAEDWNLSPGAVIKRTSLQDRYGGRRQGGIAPSTVSPNILIFTAPSGHKYGYYDGMQPDGCFHYTGEGQVGDQQFKQGNRALAGHKQANKCVRLFSGASGEVQYVGEFAVDDKVPFYKTDAPDVNGEMREVIVFRLRPVGTYKQELLPQAQEALQYDRATVQEVEPENRATEQFTTSAIAERTAERREAALVGEYLEFRRVSRMSRLCRLKIKPPGEALPLYSDLYDPETRLIIEAKGTVTRDAIRMALGQLLDYGRFLDHPHALAVLVPEIPRPDLLEFLRSNSIMVIAPSQRGFEALPVVPTTSAA